MIHGINNDNSNLNNLLGTQLSEQTEALGVTNPIAGGSNDLSEVNKKYFIDETVISSSAFEMYQRELDIKKYTDMVLNMPNDIEKIGKLFESGVKDPFTRFNTDKLVNSTRLLNDLDVSL